MRRHLKVAMFLVIASASSLRADDARSVRVHTREGTQVAGSINLKSIKVKTELGELEIPFEKLALIAYTNRVEPDGRPNLSLSTTDGDKFVGPILTDAPELKTDLATLKLDWKAIQMIEFVAEAKAPVEPKTEKTSDRRRGPRRPPGPPPVRRTNRGIGA